VGALPWTIFPGYFQPLLFVHWPLSFCGGAKSFDFRMKAYSLLLEENQLCPLWKGPLAVLSPASALTHPSIICPVRRILGVCAQEICNLQDFGDLIPDDGGIFHRMDCELVVGTFMILDLTSRSDMKPIYLTMTTEIIGIGTENDRINRLKKQLRCPEAQISTMR
jgi:hypothetical protein